MRPAVIRLIAISFAVVGTATAAQVTDQNLPRRVTAQAKARFQVSCPDRPTAGGPVFFGPRQVGSVLSISSMGGKYEVEVGFSKYVTEIRDNSGVGLTSDSDAMLVVSQNLSWVVMEPGGEQTLLDNGGTIQFAACLRSSDPQARLVPGAPTGFQGKAKTDAFLASVSALRTLAIVRPKVVLPDLDRALVDDSLGRDAASRPFRELFWSRFFANALVKVGELRAASPAACYYHPLADVALCTTWVQQGRRRFELARATLIPGERFSERGILLEEWPLAPSWVNVQDPGKALQSLTQARLKQIGRDFPATDDDDVRMHSDPAQTRLAELRLFALVEGLKANDSVVKSVLQQVDQRLSQSANGKAPSPLKARQLDALSFSAAKADVRTVVLTPRGRPRTLIVVDCRTVNSQCQIVNVRTIAL